MTDVRRADAVVIGAGQAGLAVAYHLARRGMVPGTDLVVVDRGPRSGGAWQYRWESLRLGDAHRIHDLPGMRDTGLSLASAPTHRPARDVVPEYYAAFEDHYRLAVKRPATVSRVTASARGFLVEFQDTSLTPLDTRILVNATGTWHRPRVPTVPGRDLFEGSQVTTPQFQAAADFAGWRVAVVGGGTSALGFLDELYGHAQALHWYTRRPPQWLQVTDTLPQELGVRAVSLQDEAAQQGRPLPSIVSTTGLPWTARVARLERRGLLDRRPMFTRMHRDGVVNADGTSTQIDAILWATGFEADLGHLDGLPTDSTHGAPVVTGGRVEGWPGLFLAGYGPQASTISSNRAGRTMAETIVEQLHSGASVPP